MRVMEDPENKTLQSPFVLDFILHHQYHIEGEAEICVIEFFKVYLILTYIFGDDS
jgi:hypothetical protein